MPLRTGLKVSLFLRSTSYDAFSGALYTSAVLFSIDCFGSVRSSETTKRVDASQLLQESFRSALDACAEMLDPLLEKPLLDVLFKEPSIYDDMI